MPGIFFNNNVLANYLHAADDDAGRAPYDRFFNRLGSEHNAYSHPGYCLDYSMVF